MADPRPHTRPLTDGEIALAASVFGDALDGPSVTVRCAKWWAWQPWWITMAPDGHIWCHPQGFTWSADYSRQPLGMRTHFVHELVHCWQVQVGGHLALRRPPWARYDYDLRPGRAFGDYGIEQQARMVEDAYRAREKGQACAAAAVLPFAPWRGA